MIHALPGRFAGQDVVWQLGQDRDRVFLDGVCYHGEEKAFDFSKPLDVVLAAGVELLAGRRSAVRACRKSPRRTRAASRRVGRRPKGSILRSRHENMWGTLIPLQGHTTNLTRVAFVGRLEELEARILKLRSSTPKGKHYELSCVSPELPLSLDQWWKATAIGTRKDNLLDETIGMTIGHIILRISGTTR